MPTQPINSLPYHAVFREYVQNKYPLGIDDYFCFLRLLSTSLKYKPEGYKIMKEDLLDMCKILWLKPDNSVIEFENIFDKGFSQFPVFVKTENDSIIEPDAETITNENPQINPTEKEKKLPETTVKDNKPVTPIPAVAVESIESKSTKFFRIRFGEAGGMGADINTEVPTASRKFLFTDNYFPASKRAVYQLFSSLPIKKTKNAAKVVDIEQTIKEIAKQGFLSNVVFRKEEEIFNELIILNDFSGSMIAFEQLTDLFSEIMCELFKDNDRKTMATNYYFQNVIDEYVYLNKSSTRFEKLSAFINKYSNRRVAIIIISDAGAARRSNTSQRVFAVVRMLTAFEKITPHIVWLNPVPKAFWKNNTARKIANFVPMFDISDTDLKRASSTIRGRQLKTISQ